MEAVEVIPRLWIGGKTASENPEFFRKARLGAVVNMTPNLQNRFSGVEYLRIPVNDLLRSEDLEKMRRFFPVVTEFIHRQVDLQKVPVLVHCFAGKQRSAAGVAAYLMRYHGMTPYETMQFLLRRKPDVFHYGRSINFARSLNAWNRALQRPS